MMICSLFLKGRKSFSILIGGNLLGNSNNHLNKYYATISTFIASFCNS